MSTIALPNFGSGSHRVADENLIEVLRASCQIFPLVLPNSGKVSVDWGSRQPTVLAVLRHSNNGRDTLKVSANLKIAGIKTELPEIVFGPFSEKGAALLVYAPQIASGTGVSPTFDLALAGSLHSEQGVSTTLKVADIIDIHVVEGNLGRLLYALHAEKCRMRRVVREINAARCLENARADALDRHGGDMGVLRFEGEISYDKSKKEVVVVQTSTQGEVLLESDMEYQNRLGIYRPLWKGCPSHLSDLLNGPGPAVSPGTGLLSKLGYASRFNFEETSSVFAVAMKLVEIQPTTRKTNFIKYLSDSTLIWPNKTPTNNAKHASRYLPSRNKAEVQNVRSSLLQSFVFDNSHAIAPMLAGALDRAGRVFRALGVMQKVSVTRAQSSSAGSRYELGLGVDTKPLGTVSNDLFVAINDKNRSKTNDLTAEAIIAKIQSRPIPPNAADPHCAWLWNAAGVQTCHVIASGDVYLSHLPAFGLMISGPDTLPASGNGTYEGSYHAPGDTGTTAVLAEILAGTALEWTARGGQPWVTLTDAQVASALPTTQSLASNAPCRSVFSAAGLRPWENISTSVSQLSALSSTLYDVIKLPVALASGIVNGNVAASNSLGMLVEIFRMQGLISAVPVVTVANDVLLVCGAVSLPEVAMNLGEKRLTGIRWYTVPVGVSGTTGVLKAGSATIHPTGARSQLTAGEAGLICLVAVGYARRGFTDPYEYKVNLEDNTKLLNIKQYEFLMNYLEHTYPLGIEVNTYEIRQYGVDLDSDGKPDPMSSSISKTYRRFKTSRVKGQYHVSQSQ